MPPDSATVFLIKHQGIKLEKPLPLTAIYRAVTKGSGTGCHKVAPMGVFLYRISLQAATGMSQIAPPPMLKY
jgi:hypothetical protein